jgi:hypothetical protein
VYITAGIACEMIAQLIGAKYDRSGLFVSGACTDAALASHHDKVGAVGAACAYLSDLLGIPFKGAGMISGMACALAPHIGEDLETRHEAAVAKDVWRHGKCLKLTKRRILGSSWSATRCPEHQTSDSSTKSVMKRCDEGHAATYRLKPSDGVFLKNYLNCVLSSDGLHAHRNNTINLVGKSWVSAGPGGAVGGYREVPVSFPKYMAPTVAGFANATKSKENWDYINSKILAAYRKTADDAMPGYYTIYGDTARPSPTLAQIAAWIAPARTTIDKPYTSGHTPPLVIDVVVQKGVWFHDGHGANLRFMVLIKAV